MILTVFQLFVLLQVLLLLFAELLLPQVAPPQAVVLLPVVPLPLQVEVKVSVMLIVNLTAQAVLFLLVLLITPV